MKPILHRWHSLVWLPALVLCLLLSACRSGNREVAASLDRIEQVVGQHPDSALAELVRLDSLLDAGAVRIEGDRQMARYALLKTQTHDKNYIDDTSDSLILRAVRYYDEHGSDRERMLAHFYHGAILRNAKDYGAAFFAYRQAEQLAMELDDAHYLSLIYGNLSALSYETYSNDVFSYGRKSLKYAWLSKNIRQSFSIRADMAQAFSARLLYDSAELLFNQVIDSLPASDPIVQSCLTSYIEQCLSVEKYQLADSLLGLITNMVQPVDLLNKAGLFQKKGISDSADVYVQRAKEAIIAPEQWVYYYEKLSWMAEMRGDLSIALDFKHKRIKEQNKVITSIFSKTVTDYQRDYERQQKELANLRHLQYRHRVLVIALLVILFVAIVGSYLYRLFKARNKQLNDAIAYNVEQSLLIGRKDTTLGELRNQIALLEQDLQTARAETMATRLSRLFAKHFNIYNRLGYVLFKTQGMLGQQQTIYELVEEEMKHLYSDRKGIAEIDQIIDENLGGAMTKAKSEELGLGENDIRLIRYMLLRLSSKTISYLFDKDPEIIYKRKYRLKEKLKHQSCQNANDILALIEELMKKENEEQNVEDK